MADRAERIVMLDMDGVLVDFVRGSLAFHGKTLPYQDVRWHFPEQVGFDGTWAKEFWGPLGFDFWASLPWHPKGEELLGGLRRMVGDERIVFTTSPCDTVGSIEGKIEWLRLHVPPTLARSFNVCPVKDRASAAPYRILVDDYFGNVEKWRATGAPAVLVPQPWNCDRKFMEGDDYPVQYVLDEVRTLLGGNES